jgi:hypothetical protein
MMISFIHWSRALKCVFFAIVLAAAGSPTTHDKIFPFNESRFLMQHRAAVGLLHGQSSIPETRAREKCVSLPVDAPNDRLQGSHGDSLIATRCEVVRYRALDTGSRSGWASAEYRWTSLFTAEDTTRGLAARDTVSEGEMVLFSTAEPGRVQPVWHERFETGSHALWRSVTPEIAKFGAEILLSIQHCVNGTGGCSQDFLRRSPRGRWTSVRQAWIEQLPRALAGRIGHGMRINVRDLRGEGGLYGSRDPNCCPSELLRVQLELRGDSLVLRSQTVVPSPTATSR